MARVNQMRFVWREYRTHGILRKSKRSRRLATLSLMGVTHNLLEKATTSLCTVLVRGFYGGHRIVGFSSGLYFSSPCRSIFMPTANRERLITSLPRHFFATLRRRVVQRCSNAPAKWLARIPNARVLVDFLGSLLDSLFLRENLRNWLSVNSHGTIW